jgi:hypothetical protein
VSPHDDVVAGREPMRTEDILLPGYFIVTTMLFARGIVRRSRRMGAGRWKKTFKVFETLKV